MPGMPAALASKATDDGASSLAPRVSARFVFFLFSVVDLAGSCLGPGFGCYALRCAVAGMSGCGGGGLWLDAAAVGFGPGFTGD